MQQAQRATTGGPIGAEDAWDLLLTARRAIDQGRRGPVLGFAWGRHGFAAADPEAAEIVIEPAAAALRRCVHPLDEAARELIGLHLAHALCPRQRGHVVALLGQSLDGYIATRGGQSQYINGAGSLTHLHRLRALSDAVIIGVNTAIADRPRLTTRRVPGPHAVRVVIDPNGRLPPESGLIADGVAQTLVLRAAEEGEEGERPLSAQATALHLPAGTGRLDPACLIAALAARGLTRLLVEGGGVTVTRFLEAGLLDRLQLAVSPLLIGKGRPALTIPPAERLDQALRPPCRRHLLGEEDVLFDLDLRSFGGWSAAPSPLPAVVPRP
jgi:riboflavin-specific deaminase-like protein